MSKQRNEKKLKTIREEIYKTLHDVWNGAERISERELEHKTYQLMDKLRELEAI